MLVGDGTHVWGREAVATIHELRIYHGLPGRLPALLDRFRNTTLGLRQKHGIRQVGFRTVPIGPSNQALYHLLAWESSAEREQKWTAFMSDPEWLEKRAASEKDGPILAEVENLILEPTAFSAMR